MREEKIALFDFCDTMINFQSADKYVRYVKDHINISSRMHLLETLRRFLVKTRLMRVLQHFSREGYVNKKMLLRQLAGLSEQEMTRLAESFYRELVRPNYIPEVIAEVIAEVMRLKHEGWRLFIVSGGYDVYLKYAADEFGFEDCISTRLNFQDGIFTGMYKGDDCMNNNKVKMLREYFGREDLKNCDSVAYSDSKSDIPLLKFCRKGVVVTCGNCTPPPHTPYYAVINGLMLMALRCCHGKNNSQHQGSSEEYRLHIFSSKKTQVS